LVGPLLAAGPSWVAATQNPPARVIVAETLRGARGLLGQLFWTTPLRGGPGPGLGSLLAGVLAGAGLGLPVGDIGTSFAGAYLLGWSGAALPGVSPALWCAGLLGAAAGLICLLRREWTVLLRRRTRSESPTLAPILAAAVPAFLLRLVLGGLTARLDAAATVGIALVATAALVTAAAAAADGLRDGGEHVAPWLAGALGIVAAASALPGVSMVALLLLGALYARVRPEAAGRFALLCATVVCALLGVAALPAAIGDLTAGMPFVLVGAALGSAAGGWLLLRWLAQPASRALPILASTCAAVGGLLLLLGAFGA